MIKWEYECLVLDISDGWFGAIMKGSFQPLALLNEKGADGWEVISVLPYLPDKSGKDYALALCKRPKTHED